MLSMANLHTKVPAPNSTKFFYFDIRRKVPLSEVGCPPPMRISALNGKSWIRSGYEAKPADENHMNVILRLFQDGSNFNKNLSISERMFPDVLCIGLHLEEFQIAAIGIKYFTAIILAKGMLIRL